MTRVLFVCLGNICRSPMAECVFKKLVSDAGREKDFTVASAATSDDEIAGGIGNPVYPPAKKELARHGLDPGEKRAVQLAYGDYQKWDLIVLMDRHNRSAALRLFGGDPDSKFRMLGDYGTGHDIADPWFTRDFETAYREIVEGCAGLLESLTE